MRPAETKGEDVRPLIKLAARNTCVHPAKMIEGVLRSKGVTVTDALT